eukprot:901297-Pleurochrysis_carterae.AAC.2
MRSGNADVSEVSQQLDAHTPSPQDLSHTGRRRCRAPPFSSPPVPFLTTSVYLSEGLVPTLSEVLALADSLS